MDKNTTIIINIMDLNVKVNLHLRLVKPNGEPLKGMAIHTKVYDFDVNEDDYLGNMVMDDDGKGMLTITKDKWQSIDSPNEKYPDIYFVVYNGDEEIFKSKTFDDLQVEDSTAMKDDGVHFDLGTFVVA
ncbi:hypothetical protein K6119_02470 [Paracrocinitomix mangrovi]|uniref:hypothetical protein n=1 Tax=Paracrocinitomix mangrovi TaxID=2862509 RepID=UPI001C8E1423|nr:hypothetical protein [Paracrocinitomix mangrovi]UKN02385.1 hypothetical protein K6119_02470 [Paracrocinitomix mangrovi]